MKYIVLFLIFDIDHFIALFALSDITAAVGFVQVDTVHGEGFVTILTLLHLRAFLHLFQLVFKNTMKKWKNIK